MKTKNVTSENQCLDSKKIFDEAEIYNKRVGKLLGEDPIKYMESCVINNSKWLLYYNAKYNKQLVGKDFPWDYKV